MRQDSSFYLCTGADVLAVDGTRAEVRPTSGRIERLSKQLTEDIPLRSLTPSSHEPRRERLRGGGMARCVGPSCACSTEAWTNSAQGAKVLGARLRPSCMLVLRTKVAYKHSHSSHQLPAIICIRAPAFHPS